MRVVKPALVNNRNQENEIKNVSGTPHSLIATEISELRLPLLQRACRRQASEKSGRLERKVRRLARHCQGHGACVQRQRPRVPSAHQRSNVAQMDGKSILRTPAVSSDTSARRRKRPFQDTRRNGERAPQVAGRKSDEHKFLRVAASVSCWQPFCISAD